MVSIFFYFVQSLSKKTKKYWESFEIAWKVVDLQA